MKLYLSSYFFGNNTQDLIDLAGPDCRVAIIMNAADQYGNEKRPIYLTKEIEKFNYIGYQAEELDLRDYFKDSSGLDSKLKQYDMVWVMGGNSFVLRRAMAQSGADIIIPQLVTENELVYAGFSAGSVVATPTLHGIELVDDPKVVPDGYSDEIIWNGLGLVDFSIAPHYRSDHPESEDIEKCVEYFKTNNMPYKSLRDGEVIVVNGNTDNLLA